MLEQDKKALSRGFKAMMGACSKSGGVRQCTCSSDNKWEIQDPKKSVTDTFFCLPKVCTCNDGRKWRLKLWVIISTSRLCNSSFLKT